MDNTRYVTFRIDQQTFAIDANSVGELAEFDVASLTRIPNTAPQMVGLVNLRGNVVPVIDFRVMLDLNSSFFKLDSTIASLDKRLREWEEWFSAVESGNYVSKPVFDTWWTQMVANGFNAPEISWCAAAVRGQLKQLDQVVHLLRNANSCLKDGDTNCAKDALQQISQATTTASRIFERLIASARRTLCPMLIVLRVNSNLVSMLVDEVLAVHEVSELSTLDDLPMLEDLKGLSSGSFNVDGEYIVVLDLNCIAPLEIAA